MTKPNHDPRMRWPPSTNNPIQFIGAVGRFDIYRLVENGVTVARYGTGYSFNRLRNGTKKGLELKVTCKPTPEEEELIELMLNIFAPEDPVP